MKILQHIPDFFSGFEPEKTEVNTLEELLQLPFVLRWSEGTEFDHWEQAEYFSGATLLMAIMKDGKHWVVAYVTKGDLSPLPVWHENKHAAAQ